MNIPNFRFSTSWPRIIPYGNGAVNQKGLDYYDRLVDECLKNGIIPWVTLYHWDLPYELELKGGWTNREIIHWFEEYVRVVVNKLKDRVKHWMVLNEPMVYTGAGYFLGVHAPGRKGIDPFLKAMHHTAICQGNGIKLVKSLTDNATMVGTTFSCSMVTAASEDEKDVMAATRTDALLNRLYIEPLLGLGYPLGDLPFLRSVEQFQKPGDDDLIKATPDFIGIQNYTREVVKYNWMIPYMKAKIIPANKRGVPYSSMNWEIHPPSIYEMLSKYNRYEQVKSIIVTESGIAFNDDVIEDEVHDEQRVDYIRNCIKQVQKAKQDGIKVQGYFIWSFTDNFEWSEGFMPRFGLVYINYKNQKRIVKSSGKWYADFLKKELLREKDGVATMQMI
jgi:beta-glucosidase